MSTKNSRQKIEKATRLFVDSIVDTLNTNVMSASQRSQLPLKGNDVQKALTLLTATVEEGYHKAFKVFMKEVDAALVEVERPFEDLVKSSPVLTKKK